MFGAGTFSFIALKVFCERWLSYRKSERIRKTCAGLLRSLQDDLDDMANTRVLEVEMVELLQESLDENRNVTKSHSTWKWIIFRLYEREDILAQVLKDLEELESRVFALPARMKH